MSYKLTDRFKEWTSYAGVLVGAAAVVVPQFVAPTLWMHFASDAQLLLGTAMVLMPQTAGSTAVENEGLALLRALSGKLPPQYSVALQPIMGILTRAIMTPVATVTVAPVVAAPTPALPAPVVAVPVLPAPVLAQPVALAPVTAQSVLPTVVTSTGPTALEIATAVSGVGQHLAI